MTDNWASRQMMESFITPEHPTVNREQWKAFSSLTRKADDDAGLNLEFEDTIQQDTILADTRIQDFRRHRTDTLARMHTLQCDVRNADALDVSPCVNCLALNRSTSTIWRLSGTVLISLLLGCKLTILRWNACSVPQQTGQDLGQDGH